MSADTEKKTPEEEFTKAAEDLVVAFATAIVGAITLLVVLGLKNQLTKQERKH